MKYILKILREIWISFSLPITQRISSNKVAKITKCQQSYLLIFSYLGVVQTEPISRTNITACADIRSVETQSKGLPGG